MTAWEDSVATSRAFPLLPSRRETGEAIIAQAREDYPDMTGVVVKRWCHKSEEDHAFNLRGYLDGQISLASLYHMSRPFAMLGTFEELMHRIRGKARA